MDGPPHPWVKDLLGEVGDAVLRAPVHPTVLVPPAEVTIPSTVVPVGWQRQAEALRDNCTRTPCLPLLHGISGPLRMASSQVAMSSPHHLAHAN